jgi:hypothetical protein
MSFAIINLLQKCSVPSPSMAKVSIHLYCCHSRHGLAEIQSQGWVKQVASLHLDSGHSLAAMTTCVDTSASMGKGDSPSPQPSPTVGRGGLQEV